MKNIIGPAVLAAEPSTWFVCLLGIAVVLVGLVFLICIVYLMNLIIGCFAGKKKSKQPENSAPIADAGKPIENRQEILAAVCAAVAEENGTDISAIRVLSFKKIN